MCNQTQKLNDNMTRHTFGEFKTNIRGQDTIAKIGTKRPLWTIPLSTLTDILVVIGVIGPLIVTYELGLYLWLIISSPELYILSWGLYILVHVLANSVVRLIFKWVTVGRFTARIIQIMDLDMIIVRYFSIHFKIWWHFIAPLFTGTIWFNHFHCLMGARISSSALLIESMVRDEDLCYIGNYCVIDKSYVMGHTLDYFQIIQKPTCIDSNSIIQAKSHCISLTLAKDCVLMYGSRFLGSSDLTQPRTNYKGVPAQQVL